MIITKHIIRSLLAIGLCCPLLATAAGNTEIDYTPGSDTLSLNTSGAYLDDVLKQLSTKLGFKLVLNDVNIHRLVNFKMTGKTPVVLSRLIQPDSLILSQDDKPPKRITNVILLPEGEQSREARIRANMDPPYLTDNAEDNARRTADYERRIKHRIQGMGIHKE